MTVIGTIFSNQNLVYYLYGIDYGSLLYIPIVNDFLQNSYKVHRPEMAPNVAVVDELPYSEKFYIYTKRKLVLDIILCFCLQSHKLEKNDLLLDIPIGLSIA